MVFGAVAHLNYEEGSFAFFIVIACVVTIETFFHHVHMETHDTPFSDMVSAIEKELMIVGCMAFCLKLMLSTSDLFNSEEGHNWLLGIEFADLTVPFTSFIYCIIGLVLIVLSRSHVRLWIVSYHLNLVELLDPFLLERKKAEEWGWMYKYIDFFGSEVEHQMEFRILHNIFCEAYAIQRRAFVFDEYAKRCYEKYLLSLVTISPLSWFMIALTVLCNYVRNRVHFQFYYCPGTPLPHHPHFSSTAEQEIAEASAEEYETCSSKRALLAFTFMGIVLLIFTASMAVFSRLYMQAIMAARGVYSIDDYGNFLQILESHENVDLEAAKLSSEELKTALFTAKSKLDLEEIEKQIERSEQYSNMMAMVPKLVTRSQASLSQLFDRSGSRGSMDNSSLSLSFGAAGSDPSSKRSHDDIVTHPQPNLVNEIITKGVAADKSGSVSAPSTDVESQTPAPLKKSSSGRKLKTSVKFDVAHLRKNDSSSSILSSTDGQPEANITGSPTVAKKYLISPAIDTGAGIGTSTGGMRSNSGFIISSTSTKERQKRQIERDNSQNDHSAPTVGLTKALSRATLFERNETHRKEHKVDVRLQAASENLENKHSKHKSNYTTSLKSVFLFETPELFFTMVESLIMMISFYIALWLSNFQFSASQFKDNPVMWQILPILPGLISSIIFTYLVKNSALMYAVVVLDPDVVEETIEKHTNSKLLAQQLRDKLLVMLDEGSDEPAEVQLKDLFSIIDADGSACLSRSEMKHFLQSMKVTFSKTKWNQIFMEMDRNFDDQITFDELLLFVFPQHDSAQEAERKRLSIIGSRVVTMSQNTGNDAAFEASKLRIVSMNKVSVKDHRRSSLFKSAVHPTITIAPPQPVSLQLQGVSEEEEDFSNGNIQQAVSNNGKGTTVEELIRRHNENKENEEESSVDESSEEGDSADRDTGTEGGAGVDAECRPSQMMKKSIKVTTESSCTTGTDTSISQFDNGVSVHTANEDRPLAGESKPFTSTVPSDADSALLESAAQASNSNQQQEVRVIGRAASTIAIDDLVDLS